MRAKIGALLAAAAAAVAAFGAATWARGRKDESVDLQVSEPPAPATQPRPETVEPAATASAGATATYAAPAADDLTAIKGLGKVKAAKLVEAGITTYAQIAAWTDDDIAEIGLKVNTSPGQIKREDWVGQAAALARQ